MRKFQYLIAAALLAAPIAANAAVNVNVIGTSQPWLWNTDTGLNANYQFGTQDGTGPTVITFADAGITAGGSWAISYVSGKTSAYGTDPEVDGVGVGGYNGVPFLLKNDAAGSSGTFFPSLYTPAEWGALEEEGVFLQALIATFADADGNIVGNPFAIGYTYYDPDAGFNFYVYGRSSSPTPLGATQIQLGLNDDIFSDNIGALKVCVGDTLQACDALNAPPPAVPEPATWLTLLTGFGLIGGALRLAKHAKLAIA